MGVECESIFDAILRRFLPHCIGVDPQPQPWVETAVVSLDAIQAETNVVQSQRRFRYTAVDDQELCLD